MNFKNLSSGIIYDVLYTDLKYRKPFVLSKEIKPAWNFHEKVFGQVFTCKGSLVQHTQSVDDSIRLKMLSKIPKDCIMVYDTGYNSDVAHFGDITALIARKAGSKGVVIDGCTRDIEGIETEGLPVFCKNILPIDSFGVWQIIDYNVDILVSGVNEPISIKKNDYIFGDRDGVLVIPSKLLKKVYRLALIRIQKEKDLRDEIKTGTSNLIKAYEKRNIH